MCWIAAFPCIVAFIVPLGNRLEDDSDVSYMRIFIPLFVLEAFAFFWLLCVHLGNLCFASNWDDD